MRHKCLTSRECPMLQDIDGLIATILTHNGLMLTEELVTAITDSVDAVDVKSCRVQLFGIARGLYHEMLSDGDLTQTVSFRLKSRRGVIAHAACARDLVRLFQYISGLVTCFPMDTITVPCHPLLTRSQPDPHISVWDKPDVTSDLRCPSQPLSKLVHRCGDYGRAIVDIQCTLSNSLNEMNKLKHTNANSGSSLSSDTTTCSHKNSVLLVTRDITTDLHLRVATISPWSYQTRIMVVLPSQCLCEVLMHLHPLGYNYWHLIAALIRQISHCHHYSRAHHVGLIAPKSTKAQIFLVLMINQTTLHAYFRIASYSQKLMN